MFGRGEGACVRVTKRLLGGHGVVVVACWMVLAATNAMAQRNVETTTETITTRDLNGRDNVSRKVVTQRSRTKNEERIVIEIYDPSIEAGRLALSKRIDRVTTVTEDGSETVEEVAERHLAAPNEPLHVIRRSVTINRRDGTGSQRSEQHVVEADGNGRLVSVPREREPLPRY
jgi:hypothetical protein